MKRRRDIPAGQGDLPSLQALSRQKEYLKSLEKSVLQRETEVSRQREILEGLRESLEKWRAALLCREEALKEKEETLHSLESEIGRSVESARQRQQQQAYASVEIRKLKERINTLEAENRELLAGRQALLRKVYEWEKERIRTDDHVEK